MTSKHNNYDTYLSPGHEARCYNWLQWSPGILRLVGMTHYAKLYEVINCSPGHTLVHLRYLHWISNRGSNTCSNTRTGN